MNKSNLDSGFKSLAEENKKKSVPAFFSAGLEKALSQLPDQQNFITLKTTNSKKRNWLYSAAAVGLLSTGIIGSGFASPTMAAALSKVPGLNYIFSATYEDLTQVEENPNVMYGSTFHFGNEDSGPYNLEVVETQMFKGYTEELKEYIQMDIPKIVGGEVSFIRVDKFGENQYEITTSINVENEPIIFSVVPNAINLPQFDGYSVNPVIKSNVDINGIKADVLSYQFSQTDQTDVTNYITWERNSYTMVLASTASIKTLTDIAYQVDKAALDIDAEKE
ncbi:DUF4179 domain-containing protein [Bacillus sp. CGMCC 1.16607]|uniref:DUF4179 domain-containing protein n=1 Tax=Bacillus sp. CGMCC 1.16607 TaxID=3351842 RepID=UPI00363626C8